MRATYILTGGCDLAHYFPTKKKKKTLRCVYKNPIVHFIGNKGESFNKRCNLLFLDLLKLNQDNETGK